MIRFDCKMVSWSILKEEVRVKDDGVED